MADLFMNRKKKIELGTPTRLADGRVVNVLNNAQINAATQGSVPGDMIRLPQYQSNAKQTQGWANAGSSGLKAAAQFIGDSANDVINTGKSAFGGVTNVLQGQLASSKIAEATNKRNALNIEQSNYLSNLSPEDFERPEVKARNARYQDQLSQINKGISSGDRESIISSQKVNPTKTAADTAETFLNVATLGTGTAAKSLGKQTAKSIVKNIGKSSAEGAVFGGAAGLTDSVSNGDNLNDTAKNIVASAGFSGLLGGASGVVGNLVNARRQSNVKNVLQKSDEVLNSVVGAPEARKLGAESSNWNEQKKKELIDAADPRTKFRPIENGVLPIVDSIYNRPATATNASQPVRPRVEPRVQLASQTMPSVEANVQPVTSTIIDPQANPIVAQRLQQEALQAAQEAQRPRVQSRQAAPIREADNSVQLDESLQSRNLTEEIVQAAQERKDRYGAPTLREKVGEAINPYRAGAKIDAEYARRQGIAMRDLPKTQSLEALAERTRNSGQEAEGVLRNSNIGRVIQKYGSNKPESQEFNTYRTFMRDLEQRADGRPAIYRQYSDDEIAQFIQDYEIKNPTARDDLRSLTQDIEAIQDEAVRRGVVDAETVESARMKRDGGRYEFYTPVSRATPDNLERATINANGVGSIGRQRIIQDFQGSDIPLDPSFDSLTDYVNMSYKDMARAATSQQFANRVREGVVPGARFTDTAENAAMRKAMRDEQKRTGNPKNMNDYYEIGADPVTGLQVVSGRENGSTFRIEVPPEQARFLQGLGEERLNAVLRVAKSAQTPFRTVLTGALNLPFQAISAGYNAIMSPVLSPQGFRVLGPRATVEALKSFNGNAEFQQILRSNGAQKFTGNLEARGNTTTADALAAQRNLASKISFDAKSPSRIWQKLDIPGAGLENAQRTGIAKAAFDARLRQGGTEAEAIADAVYSYNNVLPNFGRTSSVVRQADALAMYTGASVAGTRSLLTAVKRDPVGVSTRLALITGAMTGLAAYSMQADAAEEFYKDMEASKKDYLLDNNGIIILPGAYKVTKEQAEAGQGREGEWKGIIKIPLPPELRPVQHAIRSQMQANAAGENVPLKEYAQAAFDFTTGSARTLSNPAVDLVYGLSTNVDRSTGREIVPAELQRRPIEDQKFSTTSKVAIELGKQLGISPLKVDYVLGKSGFPGQAAKGIGEEGGALGAATESVANKFTNTFGQKESTKFYNTLDEIAKQIPNDDDMKAFEALHAQKDKDNKSIDKTAERYKILLARPAVLDAERKLDEYNRSQGKPGNPLFDLAPDQQEKVFRYRASKDLNNAKQAYDKNGNPLYTALGLDEKWYDDFRNAETGFYDAIKQGNDDDDTNTSILTISGAQRPVASPELQSKLDVYYTLPSGTGERSAFLRANPDVLDHWAKGDQFTNAERVAIGLEPITDEDKSSGGSGKGYGRSGGRSGGSGGGGAVNERKYAVSINAGGEAARPTVKARGGSKAPRKYVARKSSVEKPKVTSKKSLV